MARTASFELELDFAFYNVTGLLKYNIDNGFNRYWFEPTVIVCKATGMHVEFDDVINREARSTGEHWDAIEKRVKEQMVRAAQKAVAHLDR